MTFVALRASCDRPSPRICVAVGRAVCPGCERQKRLRATALGHRAGRSSSVTHVTVKAQNKYPSNLLFYFSRYQNPSARFHSQNLKTNLDCSTPKPESKPVSEPESKQQKERSLRRNRIPARRGCHFIHDCQRCRKSFDARPDFKV